MSKPTLKSNFTQVPNGVFGLLDYDGMKGNTFTVLIYLLSYQNSKMGCFPNMATIARKCRCTVSSVKRAIKTLQDRGVIKVISGKAKHTSNRYEVNLEVIDLDCTSTPEENKIHKAKRDLLKAQHNLKQANKGTEKAEPKEEDDGTDQPM